MEKGEEIDKLFRKEFDDPVNMPAFREADWEAMEQMLGERKKRPVIIYWLSAIGSAAALILVFFGWLFYKPEIIKPTKQEQVAAVIESKRASSGKIHYTDSANTDNKIKEHTSKSDESARQEANGVKQEVLISAKSAGTLARNGHVKNSKSFFTLSSEELRRDNTGIELNKTEERDGDLLVSANVLNIDANDAAISTSAITTHSLLPTTPIFNAELSEGIANVRKSLGNKGNKATSPNRPQYAISVLASPNVNGVNSAFQRGKIGGSIVGTFSATFAQKWTISTGIGYSITPYLSSFSDYHTNYHFATSPSSVYANCRILDVPLNVNYQIYANKGNRITLGTGLSSYFILCEDYKFNYDNGYAGKGPNTFRVVNKNKNILSILNIDITYTHQLNSKIGLTVQPYLKKPLVNVCESQVRLQTTGVAVGLNWNINSAIKPK